MIKKFKQTRITLSKREVIVIRSYEHLPPTWCAACGEQSRMLSVEDAAEIANASVPVIRQEVEAGRLHFMKHDHQAPGICLSSLLAWKLA